MKTLSIPYKIKPVLKTVKSEIIHKSLAPLILKCLKVIIASLFILATTYYRDLTRI